MRNREHQMQVACVNYFRMMWPKYWRHLIANANGGYRNLSTAKALRAEGVVAGVADLSLKLARGGFHGLEIEMKVAPNKPSKLQLEWLADMEREGYKTAVVYSTDEFMKLVSAYMAGVR